MDNLLPTFQFGLRVSLATVFAGQAIDAIILPSMTADAKASTLLPHVPGIAQTAIFGLLLVISIWLVFGVRTRVVALLGLALSIGYATHLSIADLAGDLHFTQMGLVAGLGLPLVAFGGGRWALYARGWKSLF